MGLFNLFQPRHKRYEQDGWWVEVGEPRHVYFNGQPCYEIDGRGSIGFFLGSTEPLYVRERRGGWTIGYVPDNDAFAEYVAERVRLGGWR